MSFAVFFTLVIALFLLRTFIAHKRSTDLDNREFAALPKNVQLAILKERVLYTPSEKNLLNLELFLKKEGVSADTNAYRPLFAEQLRIGREENAIAMDNALFEREAAWMDDVEPFEFETARALKKDGKQNAAVQAYLEGVLRYYSDEKIEASLSALIPEFPAAGKLLDGYRELKKLRDESGADDASIEKLGRAKEEWQKSVEQLLRD